MKVYAVPDPVRAEMCDPLTLERFRFQSKPGLREPKNEREEAALDHLVSIRLATAHRSRAAAQKRLTKLRAAKAGPAAVDQPAEPAAKE